MRLVLGIRLKLLFLVLLATLPAVGVVLYSGFTAQRLAEENAAKEAQHIARDLAGRQQQVMASTRQFLATLAHLPQLRSMDGAACVPLFRELLKVNPIYNDIVLTSPDGEVLATSNGVRPGLSLRNSTFFDMVLRSGSFSVGGYRKSSLNGKDVLVCGHPVVNANRELVGIISAGLLVATFEEITHGVNLLPGSTIFVADRTGTRLFNRHYPDPRPDVFPVGGKVTLALQQMLPGAAARSPFFTTGLDQQLRLFAVEEARLSPEAEPYIFVGVSVPKTAMSAQARKSTRTSLELLALMILVAAAAAWFTGRTVFVERIERLAEVAGRFAKGDLSARTLLPAPSLGGEPDELGRLGQAVDRMGEELSRQTAEREATLANLARTQFALDNAGDEIYWAGSTGDFLYANELAAKSLGYTRAELMAKSVFDVDLDFPPGKWEGLLTTLAATGPVTVETRHRTAGGAVVPKEITLSLLHAPQGMLVFGTGRDITERRRHEAVLRSLLDETISVTGQDFFDSLAARLVSVLGADAAFIGEYTGLRHDRVHPLSLVTREGSRQAPDIPLADSPGIEIPPDGHLFFSMGVQRRFSRAGLLVELGIESYLGVPILGPTGEKIGHMSVMARRPMTQDPALTSTLRLFAQRAGAEIVRLRAEGQLRASLSEKEMLLKEIHHRVKNNMQIISSLLTLQFRDVSDPAMLDLLAQSRARILSMALVHEDLYQTGNLAQVDFRNYLERLTQRIGQGLGADLSAHIELDLAPISLGIDQAIPLGLLVNELITNAFKHAPRPDASLRILVRLRNEGDRVTLNVRDNGRGLPMNFAPGSTGTLGLQLVWSLAEQLRGEMLTENDGGASFTLTFSPPAATGQDGEGEPSQPAH